MDERRFEIVTWFLAGIILLVGCQNQPPVSAPKPDECSPAEVEIIWPKLQSVQPVWVSWGGEINVTASGGYKIECGNFYNESHRQFTLYIDQEQFGMLSCMVNHCEATLPVPEDLQAGTHVISTEGGSQIEFEIIEGIPDRDGELPAALKGYELYSWIDEDRWHYTLISGTNRIKSMDELLSTESYISPEGWVKISVSSIQALKAVLEKLPAGQEIFWLIGVQVEVPGGDVHFSYPPDELLEEVRQHSAHLELELHIDRGID